MANKIFLYPAWLRLWHFINALCFLVLIITGLLMHYTINIIRFDYSVNIHNICGIILSLNYVVYFIANLASGNYKYYTFKAGYFFKEMMIQLKYYTFGLFKGESAPFPVTADSKFNPLQKFAYIMAMYLFVPVLIVTGLAMLYPKFIPSDVMGISGLVLTDLVHVIVGFFASIFMIVHIYFCTMGTTPTSNFKSIVNGWADPH